MGKKKGAKKGGDDYWDEAGEDVAPVNGTDAAADDADIKPTKSAFANMTIEDPSPANGDDAADDDDDMGGGLMGAIKKSSGKKDKKAKKNKKAQDDDIWDELGEDVSGNALPKQEGGDEDDVPASKAPVEANLDDEFPDDTKKSKGAKKQAAKDDDDAGSGAATPAQEDDGPKILTKKEKEKLKKEKEKAKKKAQAAAKKGAAAPGDADKEQDKEEAPKADAAPADGADEGDDDDEGGAGGADKKKKKKKKKAAEPAPAPAPAAGGKKPSAALKALQDRLAAQKKAEEEARLAEEEARRRVEEIERQEREEEERKEAERQRKKEKEKAKREQLKKEGKLLTPKQKAEKAAAEARMQAMIKSGNIKIEGLANRDESDKPAKRVVIDSRKKKGKGPSGPPNKLLDPSATPAAASAAPEPEAAPEKPAEPEPAAEAEAPAAAAAEEPEEDVKDSWDAESDEDVKDDWDAESEPEEDKAKAKDSGKANGAKASTEAKSAAAKAAADVAATEKAIKAAQEAGSDDDSEDDSDDGSDDSDDSDDDSDDGLTSAQRQAQQRKDEAAKRRQERTDQAMAARNKDDLRSPICVILGHVDTGKTKLLDKIRQTNVQGGEAGGITQQIGATYFPVDVLKNKIAPIDPKGEQEFKTPGLLVIDTPGHESFTNLRSRGSSLCNIAVLVVDIMHGLEPQTIESIRLLRDRKTPFVVALNKIDRLYGWQATPNGGSRESLKKQNRATQNEFEERTNKIIVEFAEQGLNSCLYYENKNFAKNVSLIPTSAHTGEGIPDLLQLIVNLTQTRMSESLMYLSELECTVLEVKVIEGLGTTIDVILSNGILREGDKIVLCGLNGPIVTQVRALLTPQPLKEMRVKGAYVHHKEVKAALGVKITAPGLEKAISGSRLLVCTEDDDEDDLKDEVMSDLASLLKSIDKSGRGVFVQASTLGSLEALLEFLKQMNIPVNGIDMGPVFKGSVKRAATMLEKQPELAVILSFDVPVDKEAEALADEMGVKIFKANIIYHLFDQWKAYLAAHKEQTQKQHSSTAVWPCRLKILAAFARRDPIILGCEILDGDLRLGTPLACVKGGEVIKLGRVTSLEVNRKPVANGICTKKDAGAGVAVRIEPDSHDIKQFGRHFDETDAIYSLISRQSIDALKDHFWDDVSTSQKKLIKSLKPLFNIP